MSLTATCSGSRSQGGGGRYLPPLSGMQHLLEALSTGVPHLSHRTQKMI